MKFNFFFIWKNCTRLTTLLRINNTLVKEANQKLESNDNVVLLKELLAGCIVEFEVTLSQFIKV